MCLGNLVLSFETMPTGAFLPLIYLFIFKLSVYKLSFESDLSIRNDDNKGFSTIYISILKLSVY